MKNKRRKQCFAFYLTQWKKHKYFEFGFNELRINDWYRLIEIVKRGGMRWWESE